MRAMEYLGVDPEADLLNGQPGSYYLNASNINAGTIGDAYLPDPITSNITGNSATTTALQTARTISLSTDALGSVSFDGTSNVTIAVTIAGTALVGEPV